MSDATREPQRPDRPDDAEIAARLAAALRAPDASARLQAALTAGTRPDPALVEGLIHRCRVEPDLNVREMLTWALIRHDPEITLPPLIAELGSPIPQARSQALHTLSKIGDRRALPAITPALLRDPDDHVARTAWRTSSGLVDGDRDPAGARWLLQQLASQLGRGGRDTQASLARAFASVGRASLSVLERSRRAADARVRIHALAVIAQLADPELRFDDAVAAARRTSFGGHLAAGPGLHLP
ncbi:HEAT repeat domain-containing protein [Clavibacter sp. VKM Ac-2872]|uniref:HEAT repeat domain-containing protein n=1 Tax=Clavibacter sp. VKM Ac-2872 TaxID=2783812 RepID=UPI00188DB24E|nr:HEAT repeat domain-containing protein [Clavibacter sp. VKM Ac-2872]